MALYDWFCFQEKYLIWFWLLEQIEGTDPVCILIVGLIALLSKTYSWQFTSAQSDKFNK